MKLISNIAVSVVALLATSIVWAGPFDLANGDEVVVNRSSFMTIPHGLDGGEFTISGVLGHVAAGSSVSFESFCLEEDVSFKLNAPYFVTIDNTVKAGGGHPQLSADTAWLYTQFRKGTLATDVAGYNYGDKASGDALQDAIWYFQGQWSIDTKGSLYATHHPLVGSLIAAAEAAVGSSTDIGSVRALNLWTSYDKVTGQGRGDVQSQLYLIPEPETYAMLMAGLGLMGVIARRRKQQSGSV